MANKQEASQDLQTFTAIALQVQEIMLTDKQKLVLVDQQHQQLLKVCKSSADWCWYSLL